MTPQELKNSILQLAIQGKLVEQRPEEGTAGELFARIQEEKQRLIKAGKIKKEKPLPEITEDEKPFEIPESWKFVRIGYICQLLDGCKTSGENYPYLEAKYLRGKAEPKTLSEGKFVKQGTKVILVDGENSGEVFEIPEDGYMGSTFKILFIPSCVCAKYILFFLEFHKRTLKSRKRGAAIPHLDKHLFFNLLFPLPPLAEQKRIVAKIEELLPYIDRYAQAWGKLEQFNSRFPEDMKKSLLQYAIQGKLVEQRPEEGTAEELFAQIQAEKQRLIKAGKIKKEKPLPEITEDEKPFEIPEGWKWVRFADLMNVMSTGPFGSMIHKSDYVEKGIPLVNPANIVKGKIIPSDKMMVSTDTAKRLESYTLHAGMIVIGRRGEMGRCAVVSENENGWICGTGSFFLTPSTSMFSDYIQTIFSTHYAKAYLSGESVGTTMSNLNHKILSKMPVPLPPLDEQKRIVEKLEQLLPLCDHLK